MGIHGVLNAIVNTKPAMIIRKHSPEILTGVGIASGVATVIFASKGTLKATKIIEEDKVRMEMVRECEREHPDTYSQMDKLSDTIQVHAEAAKELLKIYSPAIACGTLSVVSILGGMGILKKRNAAIAAAYSFLQGKFNEYRSRVRNEMGDEREKEFFHGISSELVSDTEIDENGKKHKVTKTIKTYNGYSQYARWFDDASDKWVNNSEMNLLFLNAQQNFANDLLRKRGHLFLNEVYDALGIPRSSEGAIVGWVIDGSLPNDERDNYVDFGIYSIDNQMARDFVNGYENGILLDFNVDGIIYDLI